MGKRSASIPLAGIALVVSSLACNAPAETPVATASPSLTPLVPAATETVAMPTSPPPTSETVSPTPTPPSTETLTPTPSPTPTVASTEPAEIETLEIGSPGYELVDWEPLPETGEWEGHLRIVFSGGVPPYQFALEENEPQDENYLTLRWRNCKDAPLTVRVLSGDGQEASKAIWIESPYCPEADQ